MTIPATTPGTPLRALQTTVGAVMGGLVVLAVLLGGVVLGLHGYPPTWVPWLLGALAVVAHVLCTVVGYRVPAVAPATPAADAAVAGRMAFQQSSFVRLALCESVAVVGIALAFGVTPRTGTTVVIGVVLSLALLLLHVWPGTRVLDRVERSLDRDGGRSYLGDTMHGREPGQNGALLS
ncbi:hypothetical protein ACFUC1_15225 [Pedococcus sp. NPDC057267]|uniref:hypothetical protein n=1 Tax=Pedococcus sp. NPDC057267 TaxID=3346077 RepID=UPI003642AE59